ncbi:unnamed protein product [Ophioblennius macclurei]
MANNSSSADGRPLRIVNYRVILVQVLVAVFLFVDLLLLATFFTKEAFYATMRYIFFATALMSDCLILVLTNVMLVHDYFRVDMQLGVCCILVVLSQLYTLVTPFTLTAMSLERFVAICMPLRHAALCSPRSSLSCVLLVHGLSSLPCVVTLLAVFASASPGFYRRDVRCALEVFTFHGWQRYFLEAINQLYFLNMCVAIVFCYVRIVKVARTASGEDRKCVWKGIKTVALHAFQLLLCLIQLWCPFIENAVFQVDLRVYRVTRYINYILFYLAPRCLSPLVYGLRDESFFLALKHLAILVFTGKRSFL